MVVRFLFCSYTALLMALPACKGPWLLDVLHFNSGEHPVPVSCLHDADLSALSPIFFLLQLLQPLSAPYSPLPLPCLSVQSLVRVEQAAFIFRIVVITIISSPSPFVALLLFPLEEEISL